MPVSHSILVVFRSLAMAAVAIGPVAWRWRRSAKSMFGFGAAAWFVTVALKVAWALPMNQLVHDGLAAHLPSALAKGIFDGYVGMLTGVFEVGLLFALARSVRRLRETSAGDALAFGLGFGGIEAHESIELHEQSPGPSMEKEIVLRDEARRVANAMDRLPLEHRAVLSLFAIEGLSHREIADILGVPEGTIWSRLSNARKKLAAALTEPRRDR